MPALLRPIRILSPLFVILGTALVVLALASPFVGLGIAEDSIFYRWFGLTRTDMARWGIIVGALGGVLMLARCWQRWGIGLGEVGLSLAAILVSLLLLELAARIIDGKPMFAVSNWLAERNALLTTQSLNDYDPLLGWVLKPGQALNTDDPASSFSTGTFGVRLNRPDSPADPPKGAVLAVGDSFTAGSEVGDRHTWPAHLETLVKRPVVNGGVGGWAADQIILRVESLLPALAPETVIVSFYHDDINRAQFRVYGGANKPFFAIENGNLLHQNRPVPIYRGRIDEMPRWLIVPSYSYLFLFTMERLGWGNWWQNFSTSYVRTDNDPIAVSCALLKRLHGSLMEQGKRFVFVMQYGPGEVVAQPANAIKVLSCARHIGIETIDLWEDLTSEFRRSVSDYGKLWVGHDGQRFFGHMSSRGNRFVAERIAAKLLGSPR